MNYSLNKDNYEKLEVHQANELDVFGDIIRIHEDYRKDKKGQDIDGGTVCLVKVKETQNSVYAILRGLGDNKTNKIKIDDNLRKKLGIDLGNNYGFEFKKASFLKTFIWAWNTSDTGYKISARIALVAFAVGLISLFLTVYPSIQNLFNETSQSVFNDSGNCEYDGQPIDNCEISSAIIGGYTFEMVKKFGSYAGGLQLDELFETELRILGVTETPDRGLVHKTVFELTGNKEFSPNEDLVSNEEFFTIEKVEDFKKLKLYSITGVGEQIMVFRYWSGDLCCNTIHILRLDDGRFKELPDSLLNQIKTATN